MSGGGFYWHESHYSCVTCRRNICDIPHAFGRDGMPYCQKHYDDQFGSLCLQCGDEAVEGVRVSILGSYYHDRCAKCAVCMHKLAETDAVHKWSSRLVCDVCWTRMPAAMTQRLTGITDKEHKETAIRLRNLKSQ